MDMGLQSISAVTTSPAAMASSRSSKSAQMQKMEAAAKDFESVFMAQMLKPMWEGIETDEAFGGGHGEDVMRDMMVQEYGKAMASADNFGLAKSVMDVMLKIQDGSGEAHE